MLDYTINETKVFSAPLQKVDQAVEQAVKGLEGKLEDTWHL
jgi:hypothetical protein